jgi:hypothetical protein
MSDEPGLPFPVTVEQMIDEVRRELKQRGQVYPRLVADHKMNAKVATWRTTVMRAVLTRLEADHAKESTP